MKSAVSDSCGEPVFARLPSDQRFCRAFEEFGGTFDRAASRNKQSHSPLRRQFLFRTLKLESLFLAA
jgi:hypothetical protein